jgi:hypothetical protein
VCLVTFEMKRKMEQISTDNYRDLLPNDIKLNILDKKYRLEKVSMLQELERKTKDLRNSLNRGKEGYFYSAFPTGPTLSKYGCFSSPSELVVDLCRPRLFESIVRFPKIGDIAFFGTVNIICVNKKWYFGLNKMELSMIKKLGFM